MAEQDEAHPLTHLQRLGVASVVVVALLMVGGSIFIWSGYYNVSANRDHWGITTWLLTQVRDQSIRNRASGIDVPDLSDPGLIALGAEHFRGGCSSCHGSAGGQQNPIYVNMLPRPPDLRGAADDYEPEALYWIVHSGLKYTGMPSWPAADRADEVWAVVAFLEALNARGADIMPDDVATVPADTNVALGVGVEPLRNCIRCHGDGETAPIGALVPSLNGQSPAYLARALREYAEGRRHSGFMMPVAHGLSDEKIAELADYYGSLPALGRQTQSPAEAIEQGRQLAFNGDPDRDVPACQSCHAGANPRFPRLAGQSAAYIEGQLTLWRQGRRDDTGFGAIMAAVGKRLTPEQVEAVSAYYASLAEARETP